MRKLRRLLPVAVAILFAFLLSSCVSTSRILMRGHKRVTGASPALREATQQDLVAIIAKTYDAIQSFTAPSAELKMSKGSVYVGKINDYPAFTGQIIYRKPDDIRIRGALPVLASPVFDLVSNGTDFKIQIEKYQPFNDKSLFIQGLNSAPANSTNRLENLRPEAFLSSMLIRPPDPATESVILKDETDEENALYRLEFIGNNNGKLLPGREVWFDRMDLSIVRQKEFDASGLTISDTSYSQWQPYNGVLFPAHIDINRPKDGYGMSITVIRMNMNSEVTNQQFVLTRPDGYTLKEIH